MKNLERAKELWGREKYEGDTSPSCQKITNWHKKIAKELLEKVNEEGCGKYCCPKNKFCKECQEAKEILEDILK